MCTVGRSSVGPAQAISYREDNRLILRRIKAQNHLNWFYGYPWAMVTFLSDDWNRNWKFDCSLDVSFVTLFLT